MRYENSISNFEIFNILSNSNNLSKNYKMSSCSIGVNVVAEKGDQKSPGGEGCSRRFFSDLKPPKELAEKAVKEALSRLDPKMVQTQKAAVIFDPDAARAVWGGVLGAINGERLQSLLPSHLEKLGEDGSLDPDAIAEAFWQLHLQPRSVWTHEIDVRPFKETW